LCQKYFSYDEAERNFKRIKYNESDPLLYRAGCAFFNGAAPEYFSNTALLEHRYNTSDSFSISTPLALSDSRVCGRIGSLYKKVSSDSSKPLDCTAAFSPRPNPEPEEVFGHGSNGVQTLYKMVAACYSCRSCSDAGDFAPFDQPREDTPFLVDMDIRWGVVVGYNHYDGDKPVNGYLFWGKMKCWSKYMYPPNTQF
jgi:hypothetical protein